MSFLLQFMDTMVSYMNEDQFLFDLSLSLATGKHMDPMVLNKELVFQ